MRNVVLMTALCLSTMACAKRPDAIAPVALGDAYSGSSCSQARADLLTEKANLEALSAAQNQAATGDAIGVFLVLVPVSTLTGSDKEGEIAASKGKILALERRLQRC